MSDKQLLNRLCLLRADCRKIEKLLADRWPKILAAALKAKGMSLRSFAKEVGLSGSYLSLVGSGKAVPSPKFEEVLRQAI